MVLKRPLQIFNGFWGDHHHWMFFGRSDHCHQWFYDGFLMLLPSLSMVFDGSGPLVKRCDGFDGSLWSTGRCKAQWTEERSRWQNILMRHMDRSQKVSGQWNNRIDSSFRCILANLQNEKHCWRRSTGGGHWMAEWGRCPRWQRRCHSHRWVLKYRKTS